MPIFDGYLMVDWSANSTPKAGENSIWAAWGRPDGLQPKTANLPTRTRAKELVEELLEEALKNHRRVLVGFDFPYGYPQGFARSLGIQEGENAWLEVWAKIADVTQGDNQDGNVAHRFKAAATLNSIVGHQGRFWGRPSTIPFVQPKRPTGLKEYRLTDEELRSKRRFVQSAWKLFTSGSVGSQALLGIPVLHYLVKMFKDSQVWPFQTGFTTPTKISILHAEIWPGILESRETPLDHSQFACRDEAQVFALVNVLRCLDSRDKLDFLFAPPGIPNNTESIRHEEGWILGAGITEDLAKEIRDLAAKAVQKPSRSSW